MNEKNIFLLSIKDFFSLKMLQYSVAPFFITMIVMYIIFFTVAGMGVDQLGTMDVQSTQTTIENGIPHTQSITAKLEGTAIIQFLMSYAITSWIATFLIYAVGGFLVLYASIFIAIIIIGFLTPFALKELQKRHYNDVEMIGYSNIVSSLFLVVKWTLTMLLLFFLLVPLYLIPVVNMIALNLPLYYFFHKMLVFDVASNICTNQEAKQIKFFNANNIRVKTLVLYLVSLIPFAIFFGAIFYVIYIGHTYFIQTRLLRNQEQNYS